MKIDLKNDKVIFRSTGRECYANKCIIGLSEPDEDGWQVTYGYDGCFCGHQTEGLNKKEKKELANYMIRLWGHYKKAANSE